ncbi:MAG: response regulator [Candidatus Omnitrophota bacterium]
MDKANRIMVVDDNKDFIYTMQYWLKSKGYDVVTALSGQEAIESFKKEPADLIFLDLHMPVMDGVQTLKAIREINTGVPVIIITAHASDDRMPEFNKHGVSGFFSKDKDFSESAVLIETVLRRIKK